MLVTGYVHDRHITSSTYTCQSHQTHTHSTSITHHIFSHNTNIQQNHIIHTSHHTLVLLSPPPSSLTTLILRILKSTDFTLLAQIWIKYNGALSYFICYTFVLKRNLDCFLMASRNILIYIFTYCYLCLLF